MNSTSFWPAKSDSETIPPPSRGKRNAGGFAPSISCGDLPADNSGFATAAVLAVNGFRAALCDDREICFFTDLRSERLRVLPRFALACAGGLAPAPLRNADLEDFLRDFLDIRLPFVAFGGSIIGVLRGLSGKPESLRRLGKSDGVGIWLQGIRR